MKGPKSTMTQKEEEPDNVKEVPLPYQSESDDSDDSDYEVFHLYFETFFIH